MAVRLEPGGETGREPGEEPVEVEETVYTIDELAALARIPVRTVRHYQSQKVLPRPVRQGRIAVYRQEHLQRLQLIAVLQDRGLQLSAIRDALSRVEKGQLWLEDWLGLSAELRTPWSEEQPVLLSEQELAERLGLRPGLVSALIDAGLLRRAPQQASYLVRSPGLLDIAVELEAAGVDIDLAAEAGATLRKHLRSAAGALFGISWTTPVKALPAAARRPTSPSPWARFGRWGSGPPAWSSLKRLSGRCARPSTRAGRRRRRVTRRAPKPSTNIPVGMGRTDHAHARSHRAADHSGRDGGGHLGLAARQRGRPRRRPGRGVGHRAGGGVSAPAPRGRPGRPRSPGSGPVPGTGHGRAGPGGIFRLRRQARVQPVQERSDVLDPAGAAAAGADGGRQFRRGVEGPRAGGHNAPPRGPRRLDKRGQPVYDAADDVDLTALAALGLPFWLAGACGTPAGLRHALGAGATGIQVGTAFALSRESGLEAGLKTATLNRVRAGSVDVLTDWRASPTGFPFKVVQLPDTLTEQQTYAERARVCDIGALRTPYARANKSIGYRCPAEPTRAYTETKGGRLQKIPRAANACATHCWPTPGLRSAGPRASLSLPWSPPAPTSPPSSACCTDFHSPPSTTPPPR